MAATHHDLLQRLQQLEQENAQLRTALAQADSVRAQAGDQGSLPASGAAHGLSKAAVERYSRQMILPAFGAEGERRPAASA